MFSFFLVFLLCEVGFKMFIAWKRYEISEKLLQTGNQGTRLNVIQK